MVTLLLMLLGESFAKRHLSKIAVIGALWLIAGLVLIIDALDGVLWFPLRAFGLLFFLEGVATVVLARTGMSLQTRLRYVRGGLFLIVGALVMASHRYSEFLLAMAFGLAFIIEGFLQIGAAWVVRFSRWRQTLAAGICNLLIAAFFIQPYPTHYHGTFPYCIGLWLVLAGGRALWLYAMTRGLSGRALLHALNGDAVGLKAATLTASAMSDSQTLVAPCEDPASPLIVHVWTPVGSSKNAAVRRPVIDRYVAAVDVNGVISTGHAALEGAPGIYLSLYPAAEIDRSPDEFARLLRADSSNDIAGRYLPSYPEEAQAWVPSTMKILFHRYDQASLERFWAVYRQTPIYNLTSRNCSSTVALGLEAALTGALSTRSGWRDVLRLVTTPELWVAAQIRHRAHTMAWTPGLVLDYARALRVLVHPPKLGWITLAALAWRRSTRARHVSRTGGASLER